MPNSACYCTKGKPKLSDDVSLIKKNNYPKKKLMWEAKSNRGMSIPYFRPSKSVAVNTEIFVNECLQPRLFPFIHKHHSDLNFQFARFGRGSLFYCKDEGKFAIFDNIAILLNIPPARPKENLWDILAQKIYEGGWEAKTLQELIS